jgi:hypothetical protein
MNKIAIAILVSAGTLIGVEAHASAGPIIGAMDGALVGSYFGGAHGAVAGAIIGTIIGTSADDNYYDRRGQVRQGREYARYEPAPAGYAPQAAYQPYYEPRYEAQYPPRQVVYVQSPVYESYPLPYYSGYRAPVYAERYAPARRGHYASRHEYYDQRRRY